MEFSDGKVSISANNPDLGEAVEEVEAEYKGKYLLQVNDTAFAAFPTSPRLGCEISDSFTAKTRSSQRSFKFLNNGYEKSSLRA
jgi:DNA polymerase III sliding clamp (beta) subunit (PCNA family)